MTDPCSKESSIVKILNCECKCYYCYRNGHCKEGACKVGKAELGADRYWPCEHIKRAYDDKVWDFEGIHVGNEGQKGSWINCPKCPAKRPPERGEVQELAIKFISVLGAGKFSSATLMTLAKTALDWMKKKNE